MKSIKFDLDEQMCSLELEWRQAFDASLVARATLESVLETPKIELKTLRQARERLDGAEDLKARVMVKIEHLEAAMTRQLEQ